MPTMQWLRRFINSFSPVQRRIARVFTFALLSSVLVYSQIDDDPGSTQVLTGYFPEWGPGANLNGFLVKNIDQNGSASKLTYLIFAFAQVSSNGTCSVHDPVADLQATYSASNSVSGVADSGGLQGIFHQLQELKAKHPSLKVLVSVGGQTLSGPFSSAATHSSTFASTCISTFINGNFGLQKAYPGIFDGIDIDWEYPASDTDRANYTTLMQTLRSQLDATRPGLILTAATPDGSWNYQYIDLGTVSKSINFFNVMTYNYDGPWSTTTGFDAPLYPANGGLSIDGTLQAYRGAGVPSNKIVMGVPFYAYQWTNVPAGTMYGLYQTGTPNSANFSYANAAALGLTSSNPNFHRDPTTGASWLYEGQTFWTSEDLVSAACKVQYGQHYGLGGIMVWDLSGDTTDASLLSAIATDMASSTLTCPTPFHDDALYNFETTTQGWHPAVGTNNLSGISSAVRSSGRFFSGNCALQVTFDAAHYVSNPTIYVPTPAVQPGATIQFHIWIPQANNLSAVDPFVEDHNWTWTGNWQSMSALAAGAWNTITVTVPTTAITPLQELGIQFTLNAPWSGTVYIDSVGP